MVSVTLKIIVGDVEGDNCKGDNDGNYGGDSGQDYSVDNRGDNG